MACRIAKHTTVSRKRPRQSSQEIGEVGSEQPAPSEVKGKATIDPKVFKDLSSALVRGTLIWKNADGEVKLYIALLLTLNYELGKTGGHLQVSLNYALKNLEAPLRSEAVGAVDGYLPNTWIETYAGMGLRNANIGPVQILDKQGKVASMETTKMVARQKLVADFYRAYCFAMTHLGKWNLQKACEFRMQKVLGGQSRPGMLANLVHELLSECASSSKERHIDRINKEFNEYCQTNDIIVANVQNVVVVLEKLQEVPTIDDHSIDGVLKKLQEGQKLWDRVRSFNERELSRDVSSVSEYESFVTLEGAQLQICICAFLRGFERINLQTAKSSSAFIHALMTDLENFSRRRFFSRNYDSHCTNGADVVALLHVATNLNS